MLEVASVVLRSLGKQGGEVAPMKSHQGSVTGTSTSLDKITVGRRVAATTQGADR